MAISIRIDDELEGRVQHIAAKRQRSMELLMREALEQYVAREEARDSFRGEAATAWSRYQQDRLHLTGAEVEAWLETWGTEHEAEPPKCHE